MSLQTDMAALVARQGDMSHTDYMHEMNQLIMSYNPAVAGPGGPGFTQDQVNNYGQKAIDQQVTDALASLGPNPTAADIRKVIEPIENDTGTGLFGEKVTFAPSAKQIIDFAADNDIALVSPHGTNGQYKIEDLGFDVGNMNDGGDYYKTEYMQELVRRGVLPEMSTGYDVQRQDDGTFRIKADEASGFSKFMKIAMTQGMPLIAGSIVSGGLGGGLVGGAAGGGASNLVGGGSSLEDFAKDVITGGIKGEAGEILGDLTDDALEGLGLPPLPDKVPDDMGGGGTPSLPNIGDIVDIFNPDDPKPPKNPEEIGEQTDPDDPYANFPPVTDGQVPPYEPGNPEIGDETQEDIFGDVGDIFGDMDLGDITDFLPQTETPIPGQQVYQQQQRDPLTLLPFQYEETWDKY